MPDTPSHTPAEKPEMSMPSANADAAPRPAAAPAPASGPVAQPAPGPAARETVGDLLRKERVTKRIAVETIAKDLRLNARYIKLLEANQCDALPADPYVRVYVRSIAKYLMLDPEAVLKRFYEEKGVPPEAYQKTTATKIDVSSVKPEKSYTTPLIVGAIIVGLAIISLVSGRMGWNKPSATAQKAPVPAAARDAAAPRPAVAPDTALDSAVAGDSVHALPPDSGAVSAAEVTMAKEGIEPVLLEIRIAGDSSWAQIFTDGNSWKNTLKKGQSHRFAARDSLNVHIGNNSAVAYLLNGKAMTRFADQDVLIFKIDRSGRAVKWTIEKWQSVFKGRL